MRIRCGSCEDEFWIALDDAVGGALRVPCPACRSDYVLHVPDDVAAFKKRLAARALTLVRLRQLDLPSAYSVLLGVMTLDQVPDLESVSSAPPPPVSFSPSPSAPAVAPPPPQEVNPRLSFDPAFRPAVESGDLTPMQAMQRGIRARYIDMLAARHDLPKPLAEEVADNRIPLMEALRICDPEPDAPRKPRKVKATGSQGWEQWALAATVGLAVMVGILSVRARLAATPAEPGTTHLWSVQGADVLVDGEGRTLQVSAVESNAVLSAYCAVDQPRRYVAVGEVPWAGGDDVNRTRLALLHRVGRSDELLAIVVHENRMTGRWIAGDGINYLDPEPAPSTAAARVRNR